MPKVPQDNPPSLPVGWLALIFLGLSLGFGLRLAVRSNSTASPSPIGDFTAASEPVATAAAETELPFRHTRAATRADPPENPPLTREQAELLLSAPWKHRIRLRPLLSGPHDSGRKLMESEGFSWLADFLDLDPVQTLAAGDALARFQQNMRNLIDENAVAEAAEPGIITVNLAPIAEQYQRHVEQLKEDLAQAIESSDMRKLEVLGMLNLVEQAIGPSTSLTLRLEPQKPRQRPGTIPWIGLSLTDAAGVITDNITMMGYGAASEPITRIFPPVSLFPQVDWDHEINRAQDSAYPEQP